MQLCFFEDAKCTNFHPLTLTRPVDDLRLGIFTLAEKWSHALKTSNYCQLLRPELDRIFEAGKLNNTQGCTWINSRYLPTKGLIEKINNLNEGQCLQYKDTIIAAKVSGEDSER